MSNIESVSINNQSMQIKEWDGQRVVTFADIDMVHERAKGTAKRNFNENRQHFIENIDYFYLTTVKCEKDEFRTFGLNSPRGGYLMTESGYLMLVKSFTDDLAWRVQRELVNGYFRVKQLPKPKKERLSSVNNAARTIIPVLEKAGMKPEFQLYMLKQLYDKAGVDIPAERFEVKERLFDKSAIAERVGMFSSSGRPHAQAVGAIIKKIDINEDERELTSFEINGHVGTEYQYSESVISKIRSWLELNDFPVKISADNKSFKVSYEVAQ